MLQVATGGDALAGRVFLGVYHVRRLAPPQDLGEELVLRLADTGFLLAVGRFRPGDTVHSCALHVQRQIALGRLLHVDNRLAAAIFELLQTVVVLRPRLELFQVSLVDLMLLVQLDGLLRLDGIDRSGALQFLLLTALVERAGLGPSALTLLIAWWSVVLAVCFVDAGQLVEG